MKVLVIGSREHKRAECFDWLQPFPNIEEYDALLINLQSLNREIYSKNDQIQTKIQNMKQSMNVIFNTNREIFCIINELANIRIR